MKWDIKNSYYESECKKYRIENGSRKIGGNYYRVLTYHQYSETWCLQLAQGTLTEMLKYEPKN